jgi:hypothetical protein
VVKEKPHLKEAEPFKTVLSGDREAIGRLSLKELEEIAVATLTGMTVDDFKVDVAEWITTAKHPRWNRLYIDLTYQPMLEVMRYLRDNGYKTFIDRRWPGFRARLFRTGVRHPALAGRRHGRRREIRL